jgi:ribosomal protein S18 acetylase RimI-like enzyme
MTQIRDAVADELDVLLRLWDELERAQGPYRIFASNGNARDEVRAEFERTIVDEDQRLLVAELDGEVVGMARVSVSQAGGMTPERAVFLSRVVVDPTRRGAGIGRALVDAADAFGRERGASFLVAYVFSGNTEGMKVWDALGFRDRFVQKVRPIAP